MNDEVTVHPDMDDAIAAWDAILEPVESRQLVLLQLGEFIDDLRMATGRASAIALLSSSDSEYKDIPWEVPRPKHYAARMLGPLPKLDVLRSKLGEVDLRQHVVGPKHAWELRATACQELLDFVLSVQRGLETVQLKRINSLSLGRQSSVARSKRTRSDGASDELKSKCVELKANEKRKFTWAQVRSEVHRNHSELLPPDRVNDSEYPSDATMQRWKRESSKDKSCI